jgi:hypothetical protein
MFIVNSPESVFRFEADHLSSYRPQDLRPSENNLQYFYLEHREHGTVMDANNSNSEYL